MVPGYARAVTIRAIYVHAPFCRRRCGYCDFAVTVASGADPGPWARLIALELESVIEREGLRPPLRPATLYVGGGTPSLFGPYAMSALAEALTPWVDFGGLAEWTAEANPESFDGAVAQGWAAAGVNRLSLGAQTFHGPSLRWMGRLHGPEGPARALGHARAAGIDNVSIDLIFGLPDRLGRDWRADLDAAERLRPEHLSLYGLTAEPGTPLHRRVAEGRERLPGPDAYASEYRLAAGRLAARGWEHYEVSNFCRPGRASAHNEAYWDGSAYLGLGPGAHSYLPPHRRWNLRDWHAYRTAVEAGADATEETEAVDGPARALERIWLGLRTRSGIPVTPGPERALVEGWVREGLAEWIRPAAPERQATQAGAAGARLTHEGWLVMDRLALDLEAASRRAGRGAAASGAGRWPK